MRRLGLILTALVTLLAGAQAAWVGARSTVAEPHADIIEVAIEAGTFGTLATALERADLVNTLRTDGPFTVFAPTDEAFAKLPEETVATLLRPENRDDLVRLLTYHVIAGRVDSTSALQAGGAATIEGNGVQIRLSDGRLRVNEATVVANDIAASNGVIHVIDSVLLPPDFMRPDPTTAVVRLLEAAINRGVPLYNEGQPVACVAVYETAVQAVLELSDDLLTDEGRQALRGSLTPARGTHMDASDRAWALRRAMDFVYDECLENARNAATTSAPKPSSDTTRSVFSFDEVGTPWSSVNDNVMGGISQGGFSWDPAGYGVFLGALSLANNGGFSTIRSEARDLGLGDSDGIVLRVRGDGRTYNLNLLASDNRFEIGNWRVPLPTTAGEWTEVRVPFDRFVFTVMGRQVRGKGSLDSADVRSISFSISDKNETPFRLEIDSIGAYRGDSPQG